MKKDQKIRIFINGFGRIGRSAARILLEDDSFELVGINDLYNYEQMAYLLKYDSLYGTLKHTVSLNNGTLLIDGSPVKLFCERDPARMDLHSLNVDVVLQCSGMFLTTHSNLPLIGNGAKRVIVSAPMTDDTPTYIFGVNHREYRQESIISNSSCSANAIVPLFKIIDGHFGIDAAMMSMYHSYTAYQNLLDGKHYSKDIRRTRSATQNIIPLLSSAAEATGYFFPHLKGRMYAKSIRVPIPGTTLYALDIRIKKETTVEEVNEILLQEAETAYSYILDATAFPRSSEEYVQNPYSAVVNLPFTAIVGDDLLRISAWQDNEYGYAKRLVDIAKHLGYSDASVAQ
ncbi:hypothetical protein YH65_09760 [Sulfurovum lithotrophicum]|uniref:Glyceraldehyde 3-phosphate dehydrogenase NAD(P) binding domain-containing protein n=1 Tax=Sulfurovum lithotrophicum TaxID=206403 RepID=A0A7U4RR82_9BACT|nr:type I glyceraldehyde-3-phosphate dehydrogenase [Sulfurovum lithotrophicum]AKF25633.1 hypothetical protein YH65_09760 [Sulfurovum lithotrophicum]